MDRSERREKQRIRIQIPMFVRGIDASGKEFFDLAKTLDISASGALLASSKRLQHEDLVTLTIPAPPSQSATLPAETPRIRARVRRQHSADGIHLIGIEFVAPLE